MRVLVVEDDRDVAKLAVSILGHYGWDVEVENDPRIAVQRDLSDFDSVLVDVSMPHLTGQQVLAVYAERYPHVRRVLWTAAAETEPGTADVVLFKPAEFSDIAAALEGPRRD